MTYVVGGTIAAADYQNFRGNIAVTSSYPSALSATEKVAALIGVGYGTRGYGQNPTAFSAVVTGNTVTAAQWNALRASMSNINIHTGSGLTLQSNVTVGSNILANTGTLGRVNVAGLISSLDTARLSAAVGEMTLSTVLTSTRITSWFTQVYHEFTMTFSSEDTARYFFNTGGQTYLAGSRTGGSVSSLNTEMTNMLSAMGTIKIGANSTTYTGTGGVPQAIGYYGLTGTFQNLFVATGSTVTYTVRARAEGIIGANGANGNIIRVQAVFATGLPSYSTLDGTLVSTISELKAGGVLTISPPTYATTVNL